MSLVMMMTIYTLVFQCLYCINLYYVPTTSIVISVGKNISPFQPPPKVIRVGHSFRSNRKRAIRVGFSLKCYPTIPASRLGSSRLGQLLELAHLVTP